MSTDDSIQDPNPQQPNPQPPSPQPVDPYAQPGVPVQPVDPYAQQQYPQPGGGQYSQVAPPLAGALPGKQTRSAQSLSITSVIAGAISIFVFGAVLGSVGVITGIGAITQHRAERRNGTATGPAPLILGVTGLTLGVLGIVGMLVFVVLKLGA